MDQTTIDRALLGDAEAAKECTEAGVAIPCPFCGEEASLDITPTQKYQMWCTSCACVNMGRFYPTADEALAAWNRRADLRGMVKEAPQQWIPVGERLPSTCQNERGEPTEFNVMLLNATEATTMCYDGSQWFDMDWQRGEPNGYHTVTHWMPLPAPPIDGGDA